VTEAAYTIAALVLLVGFLSGIRLMNSPVTAVGGNLLGAGCMLGAIVVALLKHGVLGHPALWSALAGGTAIGLLCAFRVRMVQMPQLVAVLNGLGGAASALVAGAVLITGNGDGSLFARLSCGAALGVGTATLTGSLVAAGKLAGWVRQTPAGGGIALSWNKVLLAAAAVSAVAVAFAAGPSLSAFAAAALLSTAAVGIVVTLSMGGADMPIAISLLNSLSGVAAAVAGLAVGDLLLVGAGGVVGAAGLILTDEMCRGMNRSLREVLGGRTTMASSAPGAESAEARIPRQVASGGPPDLDELGAVLRGATKALIVPGYGMALAQAQGEVRRLMDALLSAGCGVNFAIHPVAGRMPGHMHVLLAEVDVPYDRLWGLEQATPEFARTDVVIVVGANDVVNPAARTAEGTPIYGMPVFPVTEAGKVIVCNLDTRPGYAGVPNPLYEDPAVALLLGDAAQTLAALAARVSK
jgi:NAD(P) transhydrogenase subunit beta